MPEQPIPAYCMEWHLRVSHAFRDMLVTPLAGLVPIELTAEDPTRADRSAPAIFCQIAPPAAFLTDPASRPVWIPMWDNVAAFDSTWWRALPRHLRVVAFSDAVASRAEGAGLETLRLHYYRDPEAVPAVSWDEGPVVFYWNRIGLAGPEFLERLCAALGATRLIFMPDLDPGAPIALGYDLQRALGTTPVEVVSHTDQAQYLDVLSRSNVFLAPRVREGVGMTFVEAMSMGAATFAFDGSTMNEYIAHRRDGYLFGRTDTSLSRRLLQRRKASWPGDFALSTHRDWADVAAMDLQAAGDAARAAHRKGYAEWQASRERFARFLSDW